MRRTDMRRLITAFVAAATLALTGCGSDDADPSSSDKTNPTESPESGPAVQSVSMTQSGGIAGIHQTWEVGPSDAGHDAVFEAASTEALEGVEGATGEPPCCDFFQFDVTVQYADGSTESLRMYESSAADPALGDLVDAVLETKPEPTNPPGPTEPTDPEPKSAVQSVSMTQSGGITGRTQSWKVGPSDAGHAAVFAAARPEALDDVEGSTGKPPCCDMFQYDVTVHYSDGTTESFRMYESSDVDPALDRLVDAVLNTEPLHSDMTQMR
jgi:hypothetical protein